MIKTNEIFNELKKSVFGQDEYLKALAVIGYKHQLKNQLLSEGEEPIPSNLLVVGPSGCGKTFAVKLLTKLIDVPFYEVNCSNISQVGYKGYSIEDALVDMKNKIGNDYEHAIVYLDEFDKILDLSLLMDGKGTCSQQNFLKVLEPNVLTAKTNNGRFEVSTTINTSGITFIATGSFEVVKERIRKNKSGKMGYGADISKLDYIKITENELIENHFIPELIGRFSRLININQLTKDDFYNIVKYGLDSDFRKYESLFAHQDVRLEIDDEVYKEVVNRSYSTKTGARNITKVLSIVMDDCLSDVSNDDTIRIIHIKYIDNDFKAEYEYGQKEHIEEKLEVDTRVVTKDELLRKVQEEIMTKDIAVEFRSDIKKYFKNIFAGINTMPIASFKSTLGVEIAMMEKECFVNDIVMGYKHELHLQILHILKDLVNYYSNRTIRKELGEESEQLSKK